MNPEHDVYVISKGRWDLTLTANALDSIGVPYTMVVEPQEKDNYCAAVGSYRVVAIPEGNLGQGSIPARNFVWEMSIKNRGKKHWILDDNIWAFYRYNRNMIVKVTDGAIFRAAEDFTARYPSVKISGFNYESFVLRRAGLIRPPFQFNTRVYSCILIDNALPFRWRGRYNEDTDLCLRVLESGLDTILFNAFLINKTRTMHMKGGNMDELYQGNGRTLMAESLAQQHPGIAKVIKRWGRAQHHVDYSCFHKRIPKRHPCAKGKDGINNYGMIMERKVNGVWGSASDFWPEH